MLWVGGGGGGGGGVGLCSTSHFEVEVFNIAVARFPAVVFGDLWFPRAKPQLMKKRVVLTCSPVRPGSPGSPFGPGRP